MHRRSFRLGWAGATGALAALVLLVPVQAQSSTTAAKNGWGYGFQVQLWHYDPAARSNVIGDVKQAGFNWITEQIEWDAVELAPGSYDWSNLDNIVGDANKAGLNVLLSFEHAHEFYRTETSGLMPGDPSTYGAFLGAVASRYPGMIQGYELWNEENLDREAGIGNVDPSTYLPLLESGYTSIKAADPNALVLLGAPSPTTSNVPGSIMDDLTYLQNLYAING